MSAALSKVWYLLHDADGQVAELDIKLDRIDIEIDGLRRLAFEETRTRLERLGVDVSNYKPAPHIHRSEMRCTNHIGPDDDVEALVREAKRSKLDVAFDEFIAARPTTDEAVDTSGPLIRRPGIGQVLGVR
jgi:hypothetical protein